MLGSGCGRKAGAIKGSRSGPQRGCHASEHGVVDSVGCPGASSGPQDSQPEPGGQGGEAVLGPSAVALLRQGQQTPVREAERLTRSCFKTVSALGAVSALAGRS